jgi:hypothetical protein
MNNDNELIIKAEYDKLLETEDLKILFPSMKGIWEDDKKRFTKQWNINQEILKKLYADKIK